jgi:hypothetical protein
MTTLTPARRAVLDRLSMPLLGIGVLALAACAVGAYFDPPQFFRAYLTAYLFFLGIAHGCLAILMLYHLTGGAWGFLIRRILEAGMGTMPLLAILFAPLAWGIGHIYPWANPELAASIKDIRDKQLYLNAGFFWVRAVIYFVLWVGLAWLLSSWSREQDRTGDPGATAKMVGLSAPGLIIYGVTITFASVDWVMSLQPGFRSTIFGPWFATGEILAGMACTLIVLGWILGPRRELDPLSPHEEAVRTPDTPLADLVSVEALNDLGNLLFTFLIIWAYMTFFQFMLTWIADLPYDVSWYTPRGQGGWQYVAWAVFVLQFSVPFFLLLMRPIKRNPRTLGATAALILGMHLVFTYYQLMPSFVQATTLAQHWMDFLTPLGLGGLWVPYFLWQLTRAPLLPAHDANREGAIHLRYLDEEQAVREAELRHG